MNHYPNSTNKLFLQETTYPGDDKKTYFVAQAEVDNILALGLLPEFELSGVDFAPSAPKIAVMFTRDKHPDRDKADYSMPRATVESICLSGGRPCFISYEKATEQLEKIKPDGIYLPGGAFDVPLSWEEGEPEHPVDLKRCNVYVEMIEYAKKNKLPLLGICGGMQVLACYFGAKIKRVKAHREVDIKDFAHKMEIKEGSLLQKITGLSEMDVNSWHTWAVSKNNIGNNVAHLSSDGIVEAVEPYNPWHKFVLGIQSHPEYFVKQGYAPAVNIFKSFIKEAGKEALSKQKAAFSMLNGKETSRG